MDHSFEGFFNFFFYIAVAFIVLAVAGFDPFVLWASVSGFVISMSFIIGGGCSAYFQGLMMVFLRRPFDIGDKIATSQPYTDTSTTGSSYWIVKVRCCWQCREDVMGSKIQIILNSKITEAYESLQHYCCIFLHG